MAKQFLPYFDKRKSSICLLEKALKDDFSQEIHLFGGKTKKNLKKQ